MSRFEDTEAAVIDRLRTMRAAPEMTVNLVDVVVPLNAAGFSQEKIVEVLSALEQDRFVEFASGNRLRLLKILHQ